MMMLIIFLITDISMVGIFAGVYGNIAKYREGMLMGVHIPKSELEHPDVKELLQLYKKRNRQFYLWNMLAGIAVCLLCFTYFSIFITVWTLWFVEFCLLTILRVYHYHQKVYDIKQKNGWISSANADVSAAVDTRTSSQIAKKILPAKLHLIPAAVILIPLFFPQVRTYLLTESDGTYTKADSTIVITENANGTTTITWTGDAAKIRNAEDPTNPGWHVNFQIQAKDDFIGGNVIPTNGSDSGIYLNNETTNTKPFPQPSVNVKLLNHTLDNKEITFYKNEAITSDNFAEELLDAYKVIELDGKTSLGLGDAGIPELTDEEISSLRTGTSITKDYSYPNTNDIVGQFKFEFVPDSKGVNGNHPATVTGNTVEQYKLKVTFIPKTSAERNTILADAGKTIDTPQTEEKTINDSKLKEITVPKGGKIVIDQSVEGIYKVNVFAIYKQSTSVNPTTNEHPKLAGAKFSLTGTKSKNVYYGLSDDTGLVKWYADENCSTPILFNKWVTDSYTFKEIKAPEGYSLNPTQWTITKTSGTNIVSKVEITGEDSTPTNCTYYFNNTPLYSLPSTGGTGIYLYMIGGMMLMLIAVWILYKNKCREVLER